MAIELTKEQLKDARTYIPIASKEILAEQIAGWVIEPIEMTKDSLFPMPPMWKENRAAKNLLMLGILCRYYLRMDFKCQGVRLLEDGKQVGEQEIDFFPTTEAYDEIASSMIFNQLERLKKGGNEVSNIIFDLLFDYKSLEQMVNAEIKELLARKNDVIARAVDMLMLIGSESNLEALKAELSKLQESLAEQKGVSSDG